jgi:two-component system chemotaxis response regulator CheB
MERVRVLVVDDSPVVRRFVERALSADPGLEVVGFADRGDRVVDAVERLRPDIVTLDVEMPGADGLEALAELRRLWPALPVLMFSSITERGAEATLDALAAGATDCLAKPSALAGGGAETVKAELLAKVRGLARPRRAPRRPVPSTPLPGPKASRAGDGPEVLLIAASTGGPNALGAFLARLPRPMPVPALVVQHMPPTFTRILAERLTASSGHPVEEAADGDGVEPGRVWIAPGDYHMRVRLRDGRPVLLLDRGVQENSVRPSADVLFRTAVEVYRAGCLAVVLTGMGQDGLRGCEAVRAAGGCVLAQDEASCVVWGMPGAVSRAGLVDRLAPPEVLADEVAGRLALRASRLVRS